MIPNIIKGSGITGAIRYNMGEGNDKASGIRKLLAPGAVSRSEILGGQNFGFVVDDAASVELARRIMEFNGLPENQSGRTKKCKLDCLHLSLSWEAGQTPSPDEMREAAQSSLRALGMARAQAVYFAHHDTPQPHLHIVASRIDPLTGKTFSDTLDKLKAQAWGLQWEREHGQISPARQELHRLVAAVQARDGGALAEVLTARNPTFTTREVDRALLYGGMDRQAAAAFRATMLAGASIIGLRETTEGPVTRYTTRDVLAAERAIQADAKALAATTAHGTRPATQRDAASNHKLTREQAGALRHATGPEGFAMIAGQAGTGKSRAMAAIRDAYEAAGFKVVGLAWTNSVAQDMRDKGFGHAATIASELALHTGDRAQAPAAQWNARTVVMVDEAAMLATKDLAAVTARVRSAGAKLILVGDDRQLGSIERGGMFTPLRHEHGAAEINEVQRVGQQSQKDAFTLMHKGEFHPAMALFEQAGALHWSPSPAQAEAALATKFTADAKANPDKTRFIFAHTNEQVDRLNDLARRQARAGGKLGLDVELATAAGPQKFATGDRVQLTGNGRSRQGKEAGFVNGATGTITGIECEKGTSRVSLMLDSGKTLTFGVGDGRGEFNAFRHGYAGTIYKGQGRSIDQTYVLVSSGWKAKSSYVAMTRHREAVSVFIPQGVAANRDALAALMGRDEQKRAASGFAIDVASLQRAGLDQPVQGLQGHLEALKADRAPHGVPVPGKDAKMAPVAKGAARSGPRKRPAPAKAAPLAGKAAGMLGGAIRGLSKVASALSEGPAALVEGLFAAKPPLTPEQKIEQAKEDDATAGADAQAAKLAAEQERIAEQEKLRRAVTDRMAVMFPAETREDIERRQREQDEDRGRDRGR